MDTAQVPFLGLVIKVFTNGESESFNWTAVALILVLGMAAHGLLLLTDYVIWDGWWIQAFLKNPEDWSTFHRIFSEAGRSFDTIWYLPLFGQSSCVWISKAVSVLCWLASAVLVFRLLLLMQLCGEQEAFMVAVLGVTLPLYDVLGDLNSLSFTIPVPLFYAGWLLLVVSQRRKGLQSVVLQFCSAVFFLASFTLPSLLVFFYAVYVIWFLVNLNRGEHDTPLLIAGFRLFRQTVLFASLPAVFWIVKSIASPAHGENASYNAVSFSGRQIIEVYSSLVQTLYQTAADIFEQHLWITILAVIAAIGCAALIKRRFVRGCPAKSSETTTSGPALIGAGVFLLGAAAFPYAVVNQPFASTGWWTRCNVILNYPLALIIVGAIVWWQRSFAAERPRAAIVPFAAVVVAGIGANILNYASYQGLGAKQLAVKNILVTTIQQHKPAILQLRDYFAIDETINWYPPAIWSFIAADGNTRLSTLVIDTRTLAPDDFVQENGQTRVRVPFLLIGAPDLQKMIAETRLPYVFDVSGPGERQLLVVVHAAKAGQSGAALGIEYLVMKYLAPQKLPRFLADLAVHEVGTGPAS